ncbi:CLUMA_CG013881, isoform A [Clunio marinus]|uniref:CLUMA_CG013881, isoform A n=1 Tax=Clunio marinus TaxID=568069 RepID=A0A1J1IK51_9DIPT|nr:CLUMA_CG013881, isoform A [Clunio marinus]
MRLWVLRINAQTPKEININYGQRRYPTALRLSTHFAYFTELSSTQSLATQLTIFGIDDECSFYTQAAAKR